MKYYTRDDCKKAIWRWNDKKAQMHISIGRGYGITEGPLVWKVSGCIERMFTKELGGHCFKTLAQAKKQTGL